MMGCQFEHHPPSCCFDEDNAEDDDGGHDANDANLITTQSKFSLFFLLAACLIFV